MPSKAWSFSHIFEAKFITRILEYKPGIKELIKENLLFNQETQEQMYFIMMV